MTGGPVLGLDGGGSKTECAVDAPDGRRLALTRGGGSNHEGIGFDGAAAVVGEVVSAALRQAGVRPGEVAAACFAMAGVDLPPDREDLQRRVVAPLGLACPTRICNDAFAGFRAGAGAEAGVGVSLGTGATFCGRGRAGREVQFHRPSPPSLDRRLADALLEEHHGLAPARGFRQAYLEALGLGSLEELYWSTLAATRPYAPRIDGQVLIRAREVLFREPGRSDPALCAVLGDFGRETAAILLRLARSLELQDEPFALVLSGSLLTRGRHPALNDAIIADVAAGCPRCRPVVLDRPPVDGAVLIARELLAPEVRP